MIRWVYEQALKAETLDRVLVATDDDRIAAAVREFGGEVVMTSPGHACGTDRLAEAARGLPDAEIIVNIQGDEPLIAPESIDLAVAKLKEAAGASMSTLIAPCPNEHLNDPNVVKVVVDAEGFALYFSRSRIPYPRSGETPAWKHIGLYAYYREFLLRLSSMPPTPLEQSESLEQLRALERGYRIACAVSPYGSIGVDAPADIEAVEAILKETSR